MLVPGLTPPYFLLPLLFTQQEVLKKLTMDELIILMKKAKIDKRLVEFFPAEKRTPEHFNQHFAVRVSLALFYLPGQQIRALDAQRPWTWLRITHVPDLILSISRTRASTPLSSTTRANFHRTRSVN